MYTHTCMQTRKDRGQYSHNILIATTHSTNKTFCSLQIWGTMLAPNLNNAVYISWFRDCVPYHVSPKYCWVLRKLQLLPRHQLKSWMWYTYDITLSIVIYWGKYHVFRYHIPYGWPYTCSNFIARCSYEYNVYFDFTFILHWYLHF